MADPDLSDMPSDQTETVDEDEKEESEGENKEGQPDPGGTRSQVTVKKKPCIFCLDCVCPYEGEKRGEDCYVLTCAKCKHEEILTTENTGLTHGELDLYVGDVIMNRFRDILREQEEMKKMDVNDPDYEDDKFREVHYAYDRLFEMMKGTINSMHLVLSDFRENYNTEMIRRIARETEELETLRQRTKRTTLELTVTVSGSKETDDLVINPDSYKIPTSVKVDCFQKGKQGVRLADKVVLETVLPAEVMDGMPLFRVRLKQYRIRVLTEMARKMEEAERMENDENQSKKKRKRKKRQKYIKYDSNKENVQNYPKTKINVNSKLNKNSNEFDECEENESKMCHLLTQTEPVEFSDNVLSVFFDITFLEEDDILKENYRKEKAERLRKLEAENSQNDANTKSDENNENIEDATSNKLVPINHLENEINKNSNLKEAEVSSETEVENADINSPEKDLADEVPKDNNSNNIITQDATDVPQNAVDVSLNAIDVIQDAMDLTQNAMEMDNNKDSNCSSDSGFCEKSEETKRYTPLDTNLNTTVDTSINAVVNTNSNAPVDTNSDKPVDTDSNDLVDTNSIAAVDTNSDTPVDTNSDKPVNTNRNTAVDTNSDKPVDTNSDKPVDTNRNTPFETNCYNPVDTYNDKPVDTNRNTAVDTNSDTPVDTNSDKPVDTNRNTIVESNSDKPVDTRSNTVVDTNSNTLVDSNGDKPVETNRNTTVEANMNTAVDTNSDQPDDTNRNTPDDTNSDKHVDTSNNTVVDTNGDKTIDTNMNTAVDMNSDKPLDTNRNTAVDANRNTAVDTTKNSPTEREPCDEADETGICTSQPGASKDNSQENESRDKAESETSDVPDEKETQNKGETNESDVSEADEDEDDNEPRSDEENDKNSTTDSEPGMYIWDRHPYIPDVDSIESEYGEHVTDKATQTSQRNESYIQVEEAEQIRKEREKKHYDEMMSVSKKVLDDFETLDDIGEFTVRKVNNMFTEILHGIGDYRDELLKERRDKAVSRMERAIRKMTEKVDRVKMEVVDELTDAYRDKVVKQYQERTKCDDNQAKLRRFELLVAHYEKTDQGDKLDELLEEITALAEEMGHDVNKYKNKPKTAKPEAEIEMDDNDLDVLTKKECSCACKCEKKEIVWKRKSEIQEPDI